MNVIIVLLAICSVVFAIVFKTSDSLSVSAVNGAGEAVQLIIKLAGGLCFWSGIMRVAQKAGVCDFISKLLYPILHFIFPQIDKKSRAMQFISMNISANLLGVGNAATPFGISAMKELQILNGNRYIPSAEMINFAVINASSIQIIPTTLSVLRAANGCENPMDILPVILICSATSVFVGLLFAKIIPMIRRKK